MATSVWRDDHHIYGPVQFTQLKQRALVSTMGCYDNQWENIQVAGYWSTWWIGLLKVKTAKTISDAPQWTSFAATAMRLVDFRLSAFNYLNAVE